MKKSTRIFVKALAFALLCTSTPVLKAEEKSEATYPVRILLEPRKDAKFYQIEWLEYGEIERDDEAPESKSLKEKITDTTIERELPVRFQFFRLRSAYKEGLFGPWGDVVRIPRAQATTNPVEKSDKSEITNQPTDSTSSASENFSTENQRTDGNPTDEEKNHNANHAPQDTKKDNAAQVSLSGEVPHTYAQFYAPFLYGRDGFIVGLKTKIVLTAKTQSTPIEKIEYRVWAQGASAPEWKKYADGISVASFAQGAYGLFFIEYRATTAAGLTGPVKQNQVRVDTTGPKIEETEAKNGKPRFIFQDENYPIVVRIYRSGTLVQDVYFKQWRSNDFVEIQGEAQGYEIRAIDLLGNESTLQK